MTLQLAAPHEMRCPYRFCLQILCLHAICTRWFLGCNPYEVVEKIPSGRFQRRRHCAVNRLHRTGSATYRSDFCVVSPSRQISRSLKASHASPPRSERNLSISRCRSCMTLYAGATFADPQFFFAWLSVGSSPILNTTNGITRLAHLLSRGLRNASNAEMQAASRTFWTLLDK